MGFQGALTEYGETVMGYQKQKRHSQGFWPLACSDPSCTFFHFPDSFFLGSSFFLPLPFFLLTRACTWGRPLGPAAPESPPLELDSFAPFRLKIAPWTDLSQFLKLLKGTQFQHRFRFDFFLTPDPFLADFGSLFDAIFAQFTHVFCNIIFIIFVALFFVDLYQLLHA